MAAIHIPSPSVILSPILEPAAAPPFRPTKSAPKRPSATSKASSGSVVKGAAITKPKQSKSRNGCSTCKTKRLKCDETKPTCQQCHKRNVVCGGYHKDFKWRPFEETVLTSKSTSKSRKTPVHSPSLIGNTTLFHSSSPSLSETSVSTPNTEPLSSQTPISEFHHGLPFSDPLPSGAMSFTSNAPVFTPSYIPRSDSDATQHQVYANNVLSYPSQATSNRQFNERNANRSTTTSSSFSSRQSPRLIDLLAPGTDINTPNPDFIDFRPPQSPVPYQPSGFTPPPVLMEDEDVDVEEIVREPMSNPEAWFLRPYSPTPSSSSSSSSDSGNILCPQPSLTPGSPEMLMLRFDRQTCGILSVKDGPTENPWRTLIWPLARDSPALYHAISSMTAFHSSKENRKMRVDGVDHMRRSIRDLAMGIENMRVDTALATTLVLAFSESWDQHISTGIQHLRGAKALVNQALIKHQQSSMSREEVTRLRFLFNTWKYMDVIARLTSTDEEDLDNMETLLDPLLGPADNFNEVDPLMGCASTLFPLIGQAAKLVQKVRKTETNSFTLISQAIEVKTLIEQWEAPRFFDVEPPEDPTSEVQHSLQTAEAYRWATLLYLHQAVPEIPSESATQLAKKVLVLLATVPLSSRAIIVQIYPLLAAGCEAVGEDDRKWVEERWAAMQRRMMIGNLDKCLEVTQVIWKRRDEFQLQKSLRQQKRSAMHVTSMGPSASGMKRKWGSCEFDEMYSFLPEEKGGPKRYAAVGDMGLPSPVRAAPRKRSVDTMENIEYEMTVRGDLHWLGVMRERSWEVLLG